MDLKVILSPRAIERLEEIVRYIARDNPGAAERFGMRLIERNRRLRHWFPSGLPPAEERWQSKSALQFRL